MVFDVGTFFHCWLLAILADLFDKTWVTVVLLSAWCPVCGVRNHSDGLASAEYTLIFLGTSVALVLRTVLLAFGVDPFAWDGFCEVAATVLLCFVALKATWDWRCAVADESDGNGQPHSPQYEQIGSAAERLPLLDEGTDGKPEKASGSWRDGLPETKVLCTALLMPSILVLFTEAGDRSQGALMSAAHRRADLAIGASVGFTCSAALAVFFGYLVKRMFTTKWLLFILCALMWLICLCSLRDALLRLVLGTMPRA